MEKLRTLIAFFIFSSIFTLVAEEYHFAGSHYLASFYDCDHDALTDLSRLRQTMHKAIELSGATILSSTDYVFLPDGLTMVWLLSESHASIHTYPEHNACFIDLFTCGENCSYEKFEKYILDYLKPKNCKSLVLPRN